MIGIVTVPGFTDRACHPIIFHLDLEHANYWKKEVTGRLINRHRSGKKMLVLFRLPELSEYLFLLDVNKRCYYCNKRNIVEDFRNDDLEISLLFLFSPGKVNFIVYIIANTRAPVGLCFQPRS